MEKKPRRTPGPPGSSPAGIGWGLILTLIATVHFAFPAHALDPGVAVTPEQLDYFERRIRPVLADHCYSCHSDRADRVKGGLWLDTREGTLKGGHSGPVITPGDPEASSLIRAVRYTDPELEMPPKGKKLELQQIADLEAWVAMGAPDPRQGAAAAGAAGWSLIEEARKHWAFQPVTKPAVPVPADPGWAGNAIDAFVQLKLEASGMAPAPPAAKPALLRRVTYDLTGLPPTPAEMDAFLADTSPTAYAEVVDRLLLSPRYGERWGRYWLDVARYADTKGYVFQEERRFPFAFTYRDYVIRSFNDDKPYDRFVMEQLAADQLDPGEESEALAALGYLTLGRRFLNNQHDIIDDRIDVTMRGLQALTVSCARCHDHKFDPVSMADYYGLYGVFASSEEPQEKPLLPGATDPVRLAEFQEEKARLEAELVKRQDEETTKYLNELRQRRGDYEKAARELAQLTEGRDEALRKMAEERNLVEPVIRRFLEASEGEPESSDPLDIPKDEARKLGRIAIDTATAELRNQIAGLDVTHPGAPARAMVLTDKKNPVSPRVFLRGNPGNPGPEVPRQIPEILAGPDRRPFTKGSGRLELARAIASPDNPLTARVMVNRIWLGHFGQGLVRTPSDFGVRTDPPPHRELLDFLSATFMEGGWSVKSLHRLILLSRSYQQSTADSSVFAAKDPYNQLLWRMNPRRLDFEALRDTLLFAGGNLDLTQGGRPVEIANDSPAARRTIYGFIDRQNLPGLFRTFDFANPDTSSPQRFATTVPQQALYLMNNPFVVEQARRLARREDLPGPDRAVLRAEERRVRALYRVLYQRDPDAEEVKSALRFVHAQPQDPEPVEAPPISWKYGYAAFDPESNLLAGFTPLSHFEGGRWQPAAKYPDDRFGYVALNARGGHPGASSAMSAVRRWIAPTDGSLRITGKLEHPSEKGDGVRGVILHNLACVIGRWEVHHSGVETIVESFAVKTGDALDFVVDPRSGPDSDSFNWAPGIQVVESAATASDRTEWDAAADFAGPAPPPLAPLTPWEQYAHVLLQSNELVFLD